MVKKMRRQCTIFSHRGCDGSISLRHAEKTILCANIEHHPLAVAWSDGQNQKDKASRGLGL
jgi:hypothetical protein